MKVGRNAPCPCGSGKKYKKCCLSKETTDFRDLDYRRLSKVHTRLVDRLFPFAIRTFGEPVIELARNDFLLWPAEDELDDENIERDAPIFGPWFLFQWEYVAEDADYVLPGPEEATVAELYLEEKEGRIDPLERSLIQAFNRKPFTFLEVLRVDPDRGMQVKDVLTGGVMEVCERWATRHIEPGDLFFGTAAEVNGIGLLIGLGATPIPPERKPAIIALRGWLQEEEEVSALTAEDLFCRQEEIRGLYFDLEELLLTPPELTNTDGESLEFHRLRYKIASAEETFEGLRDLCVTQDEDELRADADSDRKGRVKRVEFPWDRERFRNNPDLTNTVLGRLSIEGRRLTVEVNSAERAQRIREEIEARLGKSARLLKDEVEDPDDLLEEAGSSEQDDLMEIPEVRKHVQEMIAGHWERWIHQELPALGGRTPEQAVKTPDGREAVEALLEAARRNQAQDPLTAEANRKGAQRVKELLGL